MTAYMIVGKSGIIDVIPLSVSSRLLLLISLPNVSKLTFLHEVPAISNSVPVVSWILFCRSNALCISERDSSLPSPMVHRSAKPSSVR